MKMRILKSTAILIMALAVLSVAANATTITNSLATFTGRVNIDQDDNSFGLQIDMNGEQEALRVDMDNAGTTHGVDFFHRAGTARVTSGKYLLYINEAESTSTAPVLGINNAGTGSSIALLKNGGGISMKSPDGTDYCLAVANGGTLNISSGTCNG